MEPFKDFIVFNKESDNFSWEGSAEQLKNFLQLVCNSVQDEQERHLEISEDAKHNAVTFKLYESSLRFYYGTKNIKIFGKSTFINGKLRELLQLSNNSEVLSSTSSSTTGDTAAFLPDTGTQVTSETPAEDCDVLEALKDQMRALTSVVNKVQQELSHIKATVEKPSKHESMSLGPEIDQYKETIFEQQQEIRALKDQVDKCNEENKSLLTVVYMLSNKKECQVKEIPYYEISSTNSDIDGCTNESKQKISGAHSNKPLNSKAKNANTKQKKETSKDEPTTSTETLASKEEVTSSTKRTSTVIMGDSIISKVEGWRISSKSNRVSVKSFAGAKVEDMMHHVRPTLNYKPDNIVLHVGTNNLKQNSPSEITEKILQLCQLIRMESPNTNLAISELMPRKDSTELDKARQSVNTSLKELCSQNKWGFINHPLLNVHMTNFRGIHPNNKGTAILAQDFKKFISNN